MARQIARLRRRELPYRELTSVLRRWRGRPLPDADVSDPVWFVTAKRYVMEYERHERWLAGLERRAKELVEIQDRDHGRGDALKGDLWGNVVRLWIGLAETHAEIVSRRTPLLDSNGQPLPDEDLLIWSTTFILQLRDSLERVQAGLVPDDLKTQVEALANQTIDLLISDWQGDRKAIRTEQERGVV